MICQTSKRVLYKVFTKFRRKFVLLLTVIVFMEVIFSITYTGYINNHFKAKPKDTRIYSVYTENCKILAIENFHASVIKYINLNENITTCGEKLPLVEQNDTHLIINEEAFPQYNISGRKKVSCSYFYFWGLPGEFKEKGKRVIFGKMYNFADDGTAKMNEEFVMVNCSYIVENGSSLKYKDYFAFVSINEEDLVKVPQNGIKYNVLIVGLDSVSRPNFHRQMPETLKYITKNLSAIELLGYTKLGMNTFPNLIPILSGKSVEELKNTCWPSMKDTFDNCSFIWDEYKKEGYATAFAEEAAWIGLFNYFKKGFHKQPVTHMWGTYEWLASKEIGTQGYSGRRCIGQRHNFRNLLEYTIRFVKTYNIIEKNYFGIFWESSITHDGLNYGRYFDNNYKQFFQTLHSMGTLENTIIFFMSDHGHYAGDYFSFYEGRLEKRMPFSFVIVPKEFMENHHKAFWNLKGNAKKLTSHWDLHETLKDIVSGDFGEKYLPGRGISLFKHIPTTRSCETAGIIPHWCMCSPLTNLPVNHSSVRLAALVSTEAINKLMENFTECIKLDLDEPLDASSFQDFSRKLTKTNYITVLFRTKISLAIYEATVICSHCTTLEDLSMSGPINRHNTYRGQANCHRSDPMLQPYCFCKNLLNSTLAQKAISLAQVAKKLASDVEILAQKALVWSYSNTSNLALGTSNLALLASNLSVELTDLQSNSTNWALNSQFINLEFPNITSSSNLVD